METMNKEIEALMYAFFTEMNKWEKFCYEIDYETQLTVEEKLSEQRKEAKKIVDRFLTKKERKRGLPDNISYGHEGSYKYNPEEEKITAIEVEKNKAIVTTRREKPMKRSIMYILKKQKGQWLIDSRKKYSSLREKWENSIL